MSTTVPANELHQHVGRSFEGHGKLAETHNFLDFVYAKFGSGFGVRKARFAPDDVLELRD